MKVISKTTLELTENEVNNLKNLARKYVDEDTTNYAEYLFAKKLLENLPNNTDDWS